MKVQALMVLKTCVSTRMAAQWKMPKNYDWKWNLSPSIIGNSILIIFVTPAVNAIHGAWWNSARKERNKSLDDSRANVTHPRPGIMYYYLYSLIFRLISAWSNVTSGIAVSKHWSRNKIPKLQVLPPVIEVFHSAWLKVSKSSSLTLCNNLLLQVQH